MNVDQSLSTSPTTSSSTSSYSDSVTNSLQHNANAHLKLQAQPTGAASLSTKKITILTRIQNYMTALVQYFFFKFFSPAKLHSQEQLSADHINLYAKHFNQQKEHRSVLLTSAGSKIEEMGGDWNLTVKGRSESNFDRLLRCFQEENRNFFEHGNLKEPGKLRAILAQKNKSLLALPLNIKSGWWGGRHWTVMHLDFNTKKISYIDSKTPNREADRVNQRLEQALTYITSIDGEGWKIETRSKTEPSSLAEQKQQYDFWNCGVFMLEFTALIGQNVTTKAIDQMPWKTMYQQIEQRRAEIATVIDPTLQENAEILRISGI